MSSERSCGAFDPAQDIEGGRQFVGGDALEKLCANPAQHAMDFLDLGFAARCDLKHLGAAIGGIFLPLNQSLGGEQIDHADEGGAFDAEFFSQCALAGPFTPARQNAQRMCGGFRHAVVCQRLIDPAAPDTRQSQDQKAKFRLNMGLRGCHGEIDSILIY